jgi:hypothetical protein
MRAGDFSEAKGHLRRLLSSLSSIEDRRKSIFQNLVEDNSPGQNPNPTWFIGRYLSLGGGILPKQLVTISCHWLGSPPYY